MKLFTWLRRFHLSIVLLGRGLTGIAAEPVAEPVEVQVTRPNRGDIHRFIALPGTLRAYRQATLYAKIPGYLKFIAVDIGDTVVAGQSLAELEVPELIADRARYRTEVRIAEIETKRVAAARVNAPDLVTPQAVDDAQGRLDLAQARLEHAETLLQYSRIPAPFDGTIVARFVDPGAFVPAASGGTSPQTAALVTLMDFRTIRAQVPVPELEASRVHPGQPVRINVEGIPGRVFEGTVARHSFALDEASRTLLVEADLPNPGLELRPGMYATVRVGVERHSNVLLVPTQVVVTERANAFVFVADSGKARKNAVKLGFNDGVHAEVVSGLDGQENLIFVGRTGLPDGTAIRPKEAK